MSKSSTVGQVNRRRLMGATAAAVGAGTLLAAPAIAQGAKRQVTMWVHFVGANFEIFNRFLKEFNDATPDVEVKAQSFGPAEITAKYLAAVAAGAPPDVFHAPGYVPPDMASNKVIAPLDGLVTLHPTTLKNFDPITVFGGQRFGVPVNGGLGAMCYNTELMEKAGLDPKKAPESWDELVEQARKTTNAAENQWGLMLGNQAGFTTAQNYYAFLLGAGGSLLTPDGKATAFNSAAGLDALTFMGDAVNKHKISPRKMYTDVQAWTEWATRKIGSVLLYPVWTAGILASKVPSMTAPPPRRAQRGAHFAGNYFTLSTASRNKEAFAKFANWWVQPAISGRWAGESGAIPNSQAAIEHAEYRRFLAQNPLGQAFLDTIPFAQPFPGVIGVPAVLQICSEMVQAVVLGGEAPKDAIAKAAAKADQELKRAQRS
ncbi:MAG: extracellular solute-binding protein [Alphaproteobacteria bacterium]|nr:extracellular solute-binding protein [Alphaproteobacteria bacterium]